jgi:hypothetical protein
MDKIDDQFEKFSLACKEMNDHNLPLAINLVRLNDKFKSVVGFEFKYTGVEENLEYNVLEAYLMRIHDSKECHFKTRCPIYHAHLHYAFLLEVIAQKEEGQDCWWLIRVTIDAAKELRREKYWEKDIELKLIGDTYWPGYLVNYVSDIFTQLEDISHRSQSL